MTTKLKNEKAGEDQFHEIVDNVYKYFVHEAYNFTNNSENTYFNKIHDRVQEATKISRRSLNRILSKVNNEPESASFSAPKRGRLRRRKDAIEGVCRELIYDVYKYFVREANKFKNNSEKIYFNKVQYRVVEATKISRGTLTRILHEADNKPESALFKTPTKGRPKRDTAMPQIKKNVNISPKLDTGPQEEPNQVNIHPVHELWICEQRIKSENLDQEERNEGSNQLSDNLGPGKLTRELPIKTENQEYIV